MKKSMKKACLLTLAVLQFFCAVFFCKVDAEGYEEIIIEDASEETSDEAYDVEPFSASPDQDEIIIEDEEYSEEVTQDEEVWDVSPELSTDCDVLTEEDEEFLEDDGDISVLEKIENTDDQELSLDDARAIVFLPTEVASTTLERPRSHFMVIVIRDIPVIPR